MQQNNEQSTLIMYHSRATCLRLSFTNRCLCVYRPVARYHNFQKRSCCSCCAHVQSTWCVQATKRARS